MFETTIDGKVFLIKKFYELEIYQGAWSFYELEIYQGAWSL